MTEGKMTKQNIKSQSKYRIIKEVTIPIDTDAAGRRHPNISALDNVIAETIQDPKYFKVEGIKISDSEYSVRVCGSRKK